jgi:hypothetical protein
MPLIRLLVPAALAAAALAGCAIGDDGPMTTQTRHVAAFTRVENPGSVDVRLHVGGPQRVRVRAGEKLIGDVDTVVRGGTLHVRFEHHGFGGDHGVVVEASVPRLDAITASGSGDVEADGVRTDALAIRSGGSGDVVADGTAGRLDVEVDGSGDADLTALAAREARVAAGGSGSVDVRADARLDVDVEGSGDVRYRGTPAITQHDDGSGELQRVE